MIKEINLSELDHPRPLRKPFSPDTFPYPTPSVNLKPSNRSLSSFSVFLEKN